MLPLTKRACRLGPMQSAAAGSGSATEPQTGLGTGTTTGSATEPQTGSQTGPETVVVRAARLVLINLHTALRTILKRAPGTTRYTAATALHTALCAASTALVVGACGLLPGAASQPKPHLSTILPRDIETLVMGPVTAAPGVQFSPLDASFLRRQLVGRLESHGPLTVHEAAPNDLPGVAFADVVISQFEVRTLEGDEVFLREIDLAVVLSLAFHASQASPIQFEQKYSFQKVYLLTENTASPLFDVQSALVELAGVIDWVLFPAQFEGAQEISEAQDPDSGQNLSTPLLTKANTVAHSGQIEKATRLWEYTLYAPINENQADLYKLTRLTLNQLADEGLPPAVLSLLEELTKASPTNFFTYRTRLRKAIGRDSPYETRILKLSSQRLNQVSYNLAAAHVNLARVRARQRHWDTATYHYGMAFAHNPQPATLQAWYGIQLRRNLVSDALPAREALGLYLRIPPPATTRHLPGSFDRVVLPPSAMREQGIQARVNQIKDRSKPSTAHSKPPLELEIQELPLEMADPVEFEDPIELVESIEIESIELEPLELEPLELEPLELDAEAP